MMSAESGAGARVLDGKVAVVTGAGQGLGLAYARAFAAAGASVVVNDADQAGVTVNAVVPVAATGMTETVPFLREYAEALRARQPLPAYARRELSFGPPGDVAGLLVFLASPAAAGITGQAIGLGGDRLVLWSHPGERVVAFADGGWSAEAIADVWPEGSAGHMQAVGQHFPEPY